MGAVLAMQEEKEEPRLYSKPPKRPPAVDVVAPDHQDVHGLLERWGWWNAVKAKKLGCASVESLYRERTAKGNGESADPMIITVERAVLGMPEPYRALIRAFYVDREAPAFICKRLGLRPAGFPGWMRAARCMVLNRLRFIGV